MRDQASFTGDQPNVMMQPGDLHNAYEAGFDLHLTKPVAPKFLHDVMNALTSKGQVKG